MPVFVKKLTLHNFCGYKDAVFDFFENGKRKPFSVLFGPNGSGKTTCLRALEQLGNVGFIWKREDPKMLLRKFAYDLDYNPGVSEYLVGDNKFTHDMYIEAVFSEDGIDKIRRISFENGVERNDLDLKPKITFLDCDHPLVTRNFQIPEFAVEKFIDIASALYGLPVSMVESSKIHSAEKDEEIFFYLDFYIAKGPVNVRYRSMSAGERKIATLLKYLCYEDKEILKTDVVLLDNMEMHVYLKRHAKMVDKLIEHFPQKQFIVTTHSETVINHTQKVCGPSSMFDMEVYNPY